MKGLTPVGAKSASRIDHGPYAAGASEACRECQHPRCPRHRGPTVASVIGLAAGGSKRWRRVLVTGLALAVNHHARTQLISADRSPTAFAVSRHVAVDVATSLMIARAWASVRAKKVSAFATSHYRLDGYVSRSLQLFLGGDVHRPASMIPTPKFTATTPRLECVGVGSTATPNQRCARHPCNPSGYQGERPAAV